jgi:ABC-type multidrug transport system permease subunit
MFLFTWSFLLFTSTFTDMIIAGIETAETAANIAQLLFSLCLIFNGVLASPAVLPGFWIFMYRISPFTYLVNGMLSVGLANTQVQCSDIEFLHFNPPSGQTCSQYLAPYIATAGGYLSSESANATSDCQFCTVSDTNTFLLGLGSSYDTRWRNFGLMWSFIVFNVIGAVFLYWLARVPRKRKEVDVVATLSSEEPGKDVREPEEKSEGNRPMEARHREVEVGTTNEGERQVGEDDESKKSEDVTT